ncbi:MAG: tRNA lysidine(34) synthetase TilS [Bacillota bacterium]|nr:tRNA lysidine(34) synthetase TilS [Bacillota bacterium]
MLEKKVLETIKEHRLIEENSKIVIGVSGGPDSICLLSILNSLSSELGISLAAVHINHMLRGEDALKDEEYVREFCSKAGIPVFVEHCDIKALARNQSLSIEEAGREARYNEFYKIAEKISAKAIAVAHNSNDQAETVLMNIIRGTGLTGLKGMDYKRGIIIRPLLNVTREEIEEYCKSHNLNPRTDSSNFENYYTRNKIRLELLPAVRDIFKTDISRRILRMSELIREDADFIEDTVIKVYNNCILKQDSNSVELRIDALKANHPAIVKSVLRKAIEGLKGDLKGIEYIHIRNIIEMLNCGKTGMEVHIPGGLRAGTSYDILHIYFESSLYICEDFEAVLKVPGTTEVLNGKYIFETFLFGNGKDNYRFSEDQQNSSEQYFDYDKFRKEAFIRTRKQGDIFKPYKSNGTKKLKEYFIDNKVPRELRNKTPLIGVENEIVWITGYRTSDKFKVTENTKRVLKINFKQL